MQSENTPEREVAPTAGGSPSASRRRLLRGGLAAGPVILTVASRPVLGATCSTASSWMSVNASRPNKNATSCLGILPSAWVTTSTWPCAKSTSFQSAVGPHRLWGSMSLMDVLTKLSDTKSKSYDQSAPARVAQYLVAAFLNLKSGKTALLTETAIKNIWTAYTTGSPTYTYSPTAGIVWNADGPVTPPTGKGGLIPWLKTTMS